MTSTELEDPVLFMKPLGYGLAGTLLLVGAPALFLLIAGAVAHGVAMTRRSTIP